MSCDTCFIFDNYYPDGERILYHPKRTLHANPSSVKKGFQVVLAELEGSLVSVDGVFGR